MIKKIVPIEDDECMAFIDRAKYHPILKKRLFHIANGGYRNILEAVKFKKIGVKAGVFDYFLIYPSQGFYGLFIEMKRKDKKLSRISPEQMDFYNLVKEVNYDAQFAYGADHAWDIVNNYLKG